jgi:hypothetical protein
MSEANDVIEVQPPSGNAEPNPEDYSAWNAWRDAGGGKTGSDEAEEVETPAVSDQTPPSEPPEEETTQEGQTATESETGEEEEQVEDEDPEEEPAPSKPAKGVEKRFRKLTGEIKALKSQLAELQQPDVDDEAEAEVVSATDAATETEAEAEAPKLSDFEDTEEQSQWDQYEAATRAFNKAEIARAIATDRAEQTKKLQAELDAKVMQQAKAESDAAWSKASARYPDYDEVVKNDAIQVSPAIISVCRANMEPELGTDIAYYFGQHPEEAARITKLTMANNEKEWQDARVRAALELAKIATKIAAEKAVPATPKAAPKAAPATPPPTITKKLTSAPKPPTTLRGTAPPAKFDLMDDASAADTSKWMAEREKDLAARGKR